MKKLVVLCFFVFAVGYLVLIIIGKNSSDLRLVKSEEENVIQNETINNFLKKVPEVLADKETVINMAISDAQSRESLEASFLRLSEKELTTKLLNLERQLKANNFFQLANSEQGLDQDSAKRLVDFMRTRQVLNKIRLDRQLEAIRKKYL